MKKLNLDLNALEVETFATGGEPGARGTVAAAEATFVYTNDACGTCAGDTCGGASCFTSCWPGGGDPRCTCPLP